MTVISKLSETDVTKFLPNQNKTLLSVFTISSGASILLLLKLYRKSLRNRVNTPSTTKSSKNETHSSNPNQKKQLDRTFMSKLLKILKILVPRWTCPEVGYMGLISSMMIVRSLCDLWTIYLATLLESALISGEKTRFNRHLIEFTMTMPLMSVTNALLKYSTRQLEIRFRSRLTKFLMTKYMYKLTFYKLNQSMRNVDQLITTDVEKFTSTVAKLYSQLTKPILDILIYVYGISHFLGVAVPGTLLGYLVIAAVLISRLRKPMAKLTSIEQALEGEYRFGNTRIITNSEEISFYKGGQRELGWILECFGNLYKHMDSFTAFKFMSEFFENFLAKYIATVVGYFAVGRPFFKSGSGRILTPADLQDRQESYYKSGRMLLNLAQAIGNLVLNAKDLSRLSGYTSRVDNLITTLSHLNKEENQRIGQNGKRASISTPNGSTLPGNGIGKYVIQDHVIKFEDVPIITPNGDMLLKSLNLEVKSGMNVLVSGPNGCGKSSLFRILGELWPLHGGVLTKPATEKLFYVPQKPYMPYGTFRDQLIYPDSLVDMKRKGISDQDLVKFLALVDLDWMVITNSNGYANGITKVGGTQEECFEEVWKAEESTDSLSGVVQEEEARTLGQRRSWDSVENWMDVLSGGQKQRLAMARLFYHKPQFAILDECTSAVSVDVEGTIYKYCRTEGITLFTVTHRKSLWDYHEYVLHMDGRGSYSFKKIDPTASQEFGS